MHIPLQLAIQYSDGRKLAVISVEDKNSVQYSLIQRHDRVYYNKNFEYSDTPFDVPDDHIANRVYIAGDALKPLIAEYLELESNDLLQSIGVKLAGY
jgi:hypothetical protein